MSKIEQLEKIIDEVYKSYYDSNVLPFNPNGPVVSEDEVIEIRKRPLFKDEFINKCQSDEEFSKQWGLKIEKKELNLSTGEPITEINVYYIPKQKSEYINTVFIISKEGKFLENE